MPASTHVLVALLGSAFSVFPLPLPIQGSRGLSSIVFSVELTVQCDGCLIWDLGFGIWGLGWRAGLVAGLRVGQAYGVFHRVWVVGFSPQILEHPTSICDTGVNYCTVETSNSFVENRNKHNKIK